MNSYSKPNDPKFTKMVIRDFLILMGINVTLLVIGVVILFFAIKNDW